LLLDQYLIMARVLLILPQAHFDEDHLQQTERILVLEGHKYEIAAITRDACIGDRGMRVKPELTVLDADKNPGQLDALVVVGGPGSPHLSDYPEVVDLIRKAIQQKSLLGSLGLGITVLAKAGALPGRTVSSLREEWARAVLMKGGAKISDQDVVTDRDVVTATRDAEKFSLALVKALE